MLSDKSGIVLPGKELNLIQINFLPNDKILDWSKMKPFADDKIRVLKVIIFVFDRVENTVEKGENASYQHSLLFPLCLTRAFTLGH